MTASRQPGFVLVSAWALVPLLLAGALSSSSAFASTDLAIANADLQAGKADEAIALLTEALKSDPNNAEANNLLCRVEYTLQQFDQAAEHCEKAVNASQQSSVYHLWLGRATGERASRASFVSAFSLAKKTREEFEAAVKLDARNAEALSDLGEFYVDAPGAVGGGVDKAAEIAAKLDSFDPARAHKLHAEIAEKNKDYAATEKELKAAIANSNHPALQWMGLASFYRRRERWSDLDSAIKSGEAAAARDKHSAVALFNGASVLTKANREPDLAIKLYQGYLASPEKTEEAPAFEAMARLAKLLSQTGDQAGAQRERAAALALAHEYKPAQEAKH